jgi:carbonic anhydrase
MLACQGLSDQAVVGDGAPKHTYIAGAPQAANQLVVMPNRNHSQYIERMLRKTTTFFLLAGKALAACNYGTYDYPREPNVPVSSFSYTGLTGPLNWYGLNKTANALCAKGMNQSPINFNASSCAAKNDSSVVFKVVDYPNGAEFENLGTNVEVVANGSLTVASKNYTLAQFHFHTPSEHRVDQEYASMEAHFVFSAPGTVLLFSTLPTLGKSILM